MKDLDTVYLDVTLLAVTRQALRVEYQNEVAWIPRSLVVGGEDFDTEDCTEEHELELMRWKAERLGWSE